MTGSATEAREVPGKSNGWRLEGHQPYRWDGRRFGGGAGPEELDRSLEVSDDSLLLEFRRRVARRQVA